TFPPRARRDPAPDGNDAGANDRRGAVAVTGAPPGEVLGAVDLAGRRAPHDHPARPGGFGPAPGGPSILRRDGGRREGMPGDGRGPGRPPHRPRRPLGGRRDPLPRRAAAPRAATPRAAQPWTGRPARHPGPRAGPCTEPRPRLEPRGAPGLDRALVP